MSPNKRMALAEAASSSSVRAGHIYSKTLLRGLANAGYLRVLYGDTFEITPKGLTWLVSHGHPTPRHAVGRTSRSPSRKSERKKLYREQKRGSFLVVLWTGQEGRFHDMPRARAWAHSRLQGQRPGAWAAFYRALVARGRTDTGAPWTEPFHFEETNERGNIIIGRIPSSGMTRTAKHDPSRGRRASRSPISLSRRASRSPGRDPHRYRFEALYAGDDRWRTAADEDFKTVSDAILHAERVIRSGHFDGVEARVVGSDGRVPWQHYAAKRRPTRRASRSPISRIVAKKTFYSGKLVLTVHLLEGHHVEPRKREKQVRGCKHNVVYRVSIKPAGARGEGTKQWVCPPAHITHAVDSLGEMRDAAGAALSFADHEGWPVEEYAAFSDSGWHVGATKLHAWPREKKR